MIEEAYCNLEIAELLKEKGMDKECFTHYIQKNNSDGTSEAVTTCTQQMAMRWLREEKGIAAVSIISSVLDNEKFLWDIEITIAKTNETYHQGWIYESYEQTCEAAIKYCLENLI